jgi:hypothetical protein
MSTVHPTPPFDPDCGAALSVDAAEAPRRWLARTLAKVCA